MKRRLLPTLTIALFVVAGATGCGPTGETSPDAGADTEADGVDPDASGPPMDEGCVPADELPKLTTAEVAGGHEFSESLHVAQAPGDDETLYVVQRRGKVLVVRDGKVLDEPFLDVSDKIITGFPSRGLLGLDFHPDYQENGRFFIDYTSSGVKRNVVAEYHRSKDDEFKADPEEVRRLVKVEDPKKQHNGGTVLFGPDGYLYVSLGNGGAGEKSNQGIGNAQIIENIFGTIMRLDVDRKDANFAAEDNPFVGKDGDDRIFVYGLRNPWRFSFDTETGDMYIGDVGKKSREEIDFVPAGSPGGLNFGWPGWEGTKEGPIEGARDVIEEHTEPIHEYVYQSDDELIRGGGATVGGQVYRGDEFPALQGYFVYGDLGSEDVVAMRYCDSDDADAKPEIIDHQRLSGLKAVNGLRGIVPDNEGNLYMVGKTKVRRIVAAD